MSACASRSSWQASWQLSWLNIACSAVSAGEAVPAFRKSMEKNIASMNARVLRRVAFTKSARANSLGVFINLLQLLPDTLRNHILKFIFVHAFYRQALCHRSISRYQARSARIRRVPVLRALIRPLPFPLKKVPVIHENRGRKNTR